MTTCLIRDVWITKKQKQHSSCQQFHLRTYPTVVVYQLQFIVRQDVCSFIHQLECHLGSRETGLSTWPTSTHWEEGSDVELLFCQSRAAAAGEEHRQGDQCHRETRNEAAERSHYCWTLEARRSLMGSLWYCLVYWSSAVDSVTVSSFFRPLRRVHLHRWRWAVPWTFSQRFCFSFMLEWRMKLFYVW